MNLAYLRPQLEPPVRAWIFLFLFWPLSDICRKWLGLNQILYPLQLLMPFFLILYLRSTRCWYLRRPVALPALILTATSGVVAAFHSIFESSLSYLGVWFLCSSALLGPPLLICTTLFTPSEDNCKLPTNQSTSRIINVVSTVFFLNNILSFVQSVVGRSSLLSVGAGGMLDAQITTNTAIELRAPGFFTFIQGNSNFSVACIIFLLSSFGCRLSRPATFMRLLAIISLPFSLVRSISRGFLFRFLIIAFPFASRIRKIRNFLYIFTSLAITLLFLAFFPDVSQIVLEGVLSFQQRIENAGGIQEGIVARFFNTLFFDAGGGSETLFVNYIPWLRSNPFESFFGYGLGYSSPLFRFVEAAHNSSYGYIQIDGKYLLVGETSLSSLLADIGSFNLLIYFWFLANILRLYQQSFPMRPHSSPYKFSVFLGMLIAFATPYFRPAAVLNLSLLVLLPYVCDSLFSAHKPKSS